MPKFFSRSGPSFSKAFFTADWLGADQRVSSVAATQLNIRLQMQTIILKRGLAPISGMVLASSLVIVGAPIPASAVEPVTCTAIVLGIGADLCANALYDWAKNENAGGAGIAQANTIIKTTSDSISNFTSFFGAREINLDAEARNGSSFARLKVDFDVGGAGRPAGFVNPVTKVALVNLPKKTPGQFARVEYKIFVGGFLVAGNGAAGPFSDPDVIKQTPLKALGTPKSFSITGISEQLASFPDEQPVMTVTDGYLDLDTDYLFAPDWNYWTPKLETGEATISDAWGAVASQLSSQSYNYRNVGTNTDVKGSANQERSVPGPLPILGAAAAFGWSRKLRKRLKSSKPEVISTTAV
jgi:hypothetical protein